MLLRRHLRDPRRRIAAGQLSLAIGLLLGRFGPRVFLIGDDPFAAGLLDGLSLSFVLLSLLLNLSGLRGMKRGDRS
ncbi:MAG: hypothetical protein JW958_12590 [Candidatus Eisenbacteria bacterium]|nr:hypothetical protein [Candidatus Eisenbacteria bacterium]